ncbi:MAG: NADH-quinone oxidoreductase subunit L [Gemmataceae bacterium]
MLDLLREYPGRFFLLATFLPLAASAFLFFTAAIRSMIRKPGDPPGKIPDWGAYVVLFALASAAVISVSLTSMMLLNLGEFRADNGAGVPAMQEQFEWIHFGASNQFQNVNLGYRIDRLTAITVSMVTVVSTLIVLFSIGYMHDERKRDYDDHAIHIHRRGRFGRFFAYLGLFAFSMLNLLIADNLLQVFISWELVGVCSFFLIGFYTERPTACAAANKAFIVNRVGDAGFLIALFIAWMNFHTFNIAEINEILSSGTTLLTSNLHLLFGLGLFLGCAGKSAQVPLQTWLPDAMEGPTPVSALIHAATMVAAGVYLVGRCFPMFSHEILLLIAVVGAITAFVSATTALVQTDIKRVLAFSTCSQLGFMMLALGIGAWTAALLHLLTHAFFKALLFLGAGSTIHACHHEQDLRVMGGLRKKLPITAYTMLIGVMAISGVPLLSGWYSKDQIMAAVFMNSAHSGTGFYSALLFILPTVTVVLTPYYMFRLWLMAFAGTPRNHHLDEHAHESPSVMTIPLITLAVFSVGVAWGWPIWSPESSFLGHQLQLSEPHHVLERDFAHLHEHAGHLHTIAGVVSLLLAVAGAGLAIVFHRRGVFLREDNRKPIRRFLDHRWYFDELYSFLFVRTTMDAALAAAQIDKSQGDVGTAQTRYDAKSLDGWLAVLAGGAATLGDGLKYSNRGRPRVYVLVLALTAAATLGILSCLAR